MKFAAFSIKHKVATTLAAILVVIFGYLCYAQLPLALMPSMEVKMAVVVTTYSGAGPEEVENLVTRIIESACSSVSGLDELTSTSSEGQSMVSVQFTDETDLDEAVTDLRDKVSRVEGRLPDGADSPSIMKMDPDAMPVVTIGLQGQDLAEMQSIAEDEIGPYLERLSGVASVDISGGYENEVEINWMPSIMPPIWNRPLQTAIPFGPRKMRYAKPRTIMKTVSRTISMPTKPPRSN